MSQRPTHQLVTGIATSNNAITPLQKTPISLAHEGQSQQVAGNPSALHQTIQTSFNKTAQPLCQTVPIATDMTLPVKNWSTQHYAQLAEWVKEHTPGEEIMQRCKINRRKELQALVQISSQQKKEYLEIHWSTDCHLGEGHRALPPLKVADDGSFRISQRRLERMGLKFPKGAKLSVQKGNNNNVTVQVSG